MNASNNLAFTLEGDIQVNLRATMNEKLKTIFEKLFKT